MSSTSWRRSGTFGWSASAVAAAVLVVVPVAMLATSVLNPSGEVWAQQWRTRLPGEIVNTAVLLVGVAVGTVVLGAGLAWLVSAFRFPGSRWFGWMLILPFAMPSYILGFLTLSTLGRTGPIQDAWRSMFGVDAWFPEVESIGGAIVAFTLVLYPYVYLLVRAALRDQAAGAYHAARTLGAGPAEAARRVVLPLVRPAIAAGGSIVMMETLTDFATVEYFGVDAWFPEVESIGGAIVAFTLVLYPYVYLLVRAALRDQAAGAYHAARTLGAGPAEAARRVVLPLVRPAIAAGGSIVMMETLTDFATVEYFGVDTVSYGVFRIWRGTYDRDAASEIATLVLAFALLAIGLERIGRGRAKFGQSGGAAAGLEQRTLTGWRAVAATAVCGAVVLAAFVGPVLQLTVWAVREQTGDRGTPLLDQYPAYLWHSLQLVAITVLICTLIALVVANARRFGGRRVTQLASRAVAVGYAVPGPVVGIGVLLVAVGVDQLLGNVGLGLPGAVATGSLLVLVYAYTVRFLAPGLSAVESGVGQVPEEMTASARTLGAPPLETARRVHLPLARASLFTAAVLVGVDALKELPIVLLLRPFGFDTLPVWVYNLASESRYEQAALPALSIIVVALMPVFLLSRRLDGASR